MRIFTSSSIFLSIRTQPAEYVFVVGNFGGQFTLFMENIYYVISLKKVFPFIFLVV